MENGPRKATDIILDLERKINNLTQQLSNQDLTLKIISNKLSEIMSNLQKNQTQKITVEAVNSFPTVSNFPIDAEKQILVSSESRLSEETAPQGFRRTSRPETYAGDNAYLKPPTKKKEDVVSFPVQIPRANGQTEIVVPDMVSNLNKKNDNQSSVKTPVQKKSGNAIPTMQRIVDRNGKSVFLADVEIIDLSTVESINKTRTNGTGKWQASLPVGEYKIIVKKLESLTKQKIETIQTIMVDGTQSPLELPMMIIK